MQKVTRFKCDSCGREYATEEEARKCEETCGGQYMCYMLEIVPSTGSVSFHSTPVGTWSKPVCVEMYKSQEVDEEEEETNDRFVFHLTRPRNSGFTEDEARRLLVAKAHEWLGRLSKEIDKVLYFQM